MLSDVLTPLYHHYILALVIFLELIAGIKLWIEVLNGGTSSNVGSRFLSCTLVYIEYIGIELIYAVIPVCCGLPLDIESFSLVTMIFKRKICRTTQKFWMTLSAVKGLIMTSLDLHTIRQKMDRAPKQWNKKHIPKSMQKQSKEIGVKP